MDKLFHRKELIYTIYQERSFSKAAQKLFISQPSLSAMVRRLEEEIGLPLFDRTCKPVRLTEAGMEYIKATEEIRHVENAFFNYVCAVNDLQAGSLLIGSNQLLSSLVLPKYISAFIRRYPKIRLELVDDNSTVLENKMTAGQLDLVIDNTELSEELFERRYLMTEHLLLAVPAAFSRSGALDGCRLTYQDILADRHTAPEVPAVSLAEFSDVPFILMTRDNETRGRTEEIFGAAGFRPAAILEIDRLVTLYNFIEIGTAASVVSDTLVKNIRHDDGGILFYKLPTPFAQRDIYAFYKRNRYYSKAMESFLDMLSGFS